MVYAPLHTLSTQYPFLAPLTPASSPSRAMSAGGSTGGSTDFVWIKLATAKEDAFAKIFYPPGKDVSDVAALACSSLGWGLTANKVRLFMLAKAGPKPQLPAPEALKDLKPLAEEATLESAGVTSGAWLVAAPATPDSSGGGGDVGAS